MGPVAVLGTLVAVSLLLLGATMRQTGRASRRQRPRYRRAVPWILGGVLLVGSLLAAIPGVPPIVVAGLVAYTGIAVAATWHMATLDGDSPWMPPSRRVARIGMAAVGLTWLGVVLGLLLRIADLIAYTPYGP